ncbi:M78 family metallopeptidase domain-containing protein [Natronococcus wangiae]|uniref:ArdC-like ssDNA-binding domain-containing protein n=1 Tax=Natronococcus wangiae TaxID=3068275 RepID=UPI00273E3985|nr:ArdC-like ssDNA-binding domain-containing protein [Natronococcus sp. AD5]
MAVTTERSVSFTDTETRSDEMNSAIEAWVDELIELVDEAQASEEFQAWLDVQSQFHDYSYRNTLLIKQQCPHATRVAGYNTWRTELDLYVQEGESAIWIWAPIITNQCPECGNSPSYHENSDCEYDETPPEEWSKGLVGFKPTAVFDVSQTEGEPLPTLETEATGNADDLMPALLESAERLDVETRIVSPDEWDYGEAKGVCKQRCPMTMRPRVEVKDRDNQADLAGTLIHEFAHALLHFDIEDRDERSKRELEAEAVAYVVGRYFELEMSGSAFYLAAWNGDDAETITDRLGRISHTAQELIDTLEQELERGPKAESKTGEAE